MNTRTYESYVEEACKRSADLCRYSAVVEIVNYRTGTSRMAVMTGLNKIATSSRGCEFVGVVCQFFCGKGVA